MKDHAVTDALGTTILVGLTVVMAGAFAVVVQARMQPEHVFAAELRLTADAGSDGIWGTGDERLALAHVGGEPLASGSLVVSGALDGTQFRHVVGDYDGARDRFAIGDRWSANMPISDGSSLRAFVVADHGSGGALLAQLTMEAPA